MTSLYNASLESYQKILKPCRELEKRLAPYREIQRQIKTLQSVANKLSIPNYIVSIPTKILESGRTSVKGQQDEKDLKETSQEASNSKNELSEQNQLSIDKLPFGFSNSHILQK